MSIDTLHPRPWRQGTKGWLERDIIDADGGHVASCRHDEAAAHIVNAVNAGNTVEKRALATEYRGGAL